MKQIIAAMAAMVISASSIAGVVFRVNTQAL